MCRWHRLRRISTTDHRWPSVLQPPVRDLPPAPGQNDLRLRLSPWNSPCRQEGALEWRAVATSGHSREIPAHCRKQSHCSIAAQNKPSADPDSDTRVRGGGRFFPSPVEWIREARSEERRVGK